MFDPRVTIAIICAYMGLLFCIAHWAERRASEGRSAAKNSAVYSLSLAVYCTAWTYYGSVGKAATSGWLFLTMYLGPTLGIFLWWTVLRKLVRIKNRHHITSIADFISARYGKSQTLAATATVIAVIGITPYIALQLKAVTSTFCLITDYSQTAHSWAIGHLGAIVMGLMSLFAIMFGARRLDPTERHEGMVMALTVECAVKLVVFLAAGIFVTYVMYDGFADIFRRFSETPMFQQIAIGQTHSSSYLDWITYLVLAMSGVLFLPRQFHIAVVENSNEKHILKAMWMFPLYLLLINLFVMPIAMGGLMKGYSAQQADTFVLSLPLRHSGPWLTLAVFVGGFSAATGMIMISSMTLATMLTNHLLLPFVERTKRLLFLRRHLLRCRWAAIAGIIMLGYWFESKVGETYMLASMGILSFAAVFQFAPSILGGIFWPKGNKAGAILGMSAGFFIWVYTLLVPSFVRSGWLSASLIKDGPWGMWFLKPEELFGLAGLSPLNHGVFWSMVFNIGLYVAASLYFVGSEEEQSKAQEFLDDISVGPSTDLSTYGEAYIDLSNKKKEVENVLGQYLSETEAEVIIVKCLEAVGVDGKNLISVAELAEFLKEVEVSLAGSIGAATAHRALSQGIVFDPREAGELTAVYAQILQNLKLSPTELRARIDYYKERDVLLSCQSAELETRVSERTSELASSNLQLKVEVEERRKAEAALRESEQRFRSLFERHHAIMLLVDPETGAILDANPAAAEFYGYSRAELSAMNIADINQLPPAEIAAARQSIEKEERVYFVFPHRLRNGEIRTVEVHSSPLKLDGQPVQFSIIHDITERKILESQLARLVTAIEQVAEGIVITDTNWIVQYANPAFERITGYGRGEVIDRHLSILENDSNKEQLHTVLQDALSRGDWWSGRLVNKKKNGVLYDAEITASAVRDETGSIINYVSLHRDVTHEVLLEKELQQSQKMEAIGTLAGGIAHDFNNILTAIMGYTELSLSKAPKGDPLRNNLEQVLKAATRASEVVRQILTFSRQSEREVKPVKIVPIVQEALALLRSSLPSTVRMNQDMAIGPENGVVLADTIQIHQLLMNLCTNAAHAMQAKGGTLGVGISEIADESSAPSLEGLDGGRYVCLTVSDTGVGMNPAVMERIFEPYFTTKEPGKGTGLGLAVVQGIVRNHGGKITVSSELGQGTTFRIFLPAFREAVSLECKAADQPLPIGGERILFVDDEEALAGLGKQILKSLGYDVTALTVSREALEIFRAQPDSFDLVITDMTMPDLTGRELGRELMAIRPDIPIILATGFSEVMNEKMAMEDGISLFIMKPYTVSSLAGCIRKALQRN